MEEGHTHTTLPLGVPVQRYVATRARDTHRIRLLRRTDGRV